MISEFRMENLSTGVEVLFGQEPSSMFLFGDGDVDWGRAMAVHNTYTYPGQIGSHISSTIVSERSVSINGYVFYIPTEADKVAYKSVSRLNEFCYSKILDKKRVLNELISPLEYVRVHVSGYYIDGKPDSSIRYSKNERENNIYFCRFSIDLTCNDPTFKKESPIQTILSGSIPSFHFPLVFSKGKGIVFGIRRKYSLIGIENSGQVSVGCRILIRATGAVKNLMIENVLTGEMLRIDKTLEAGERVEINTNEGSERGVIGYKDGFWTNYFKYWNFNNDWLQFPIGGSLLGYSVEEGSESSVEIAVVITPKKLALEDM